jgi:hypothetical protein
MTTDNMQLLETEQGNWDLYIDANNWIWYIAKEGSGAKSGYWGNIKHYKGVYGKAI